MSFNFYDFFGDHFTPITDERRAGNFSRRAAGVVPAVSHRRVQQLRVQKAACWNKFPGLE